YYYLKNYNQAFADLNKAIQLGVDGKDLGEVLYYRGLCYQQLGDETKAQADFARAKELGYNG
ncbi:MAG: tetratricopeptide repeat protein, partial [Selenomonadaceae bacterium]|nr:tetratricopeptide repeat protein [Selenomonadaceae bacterium]